MVKGEDSIRRKKNKVTRKKLRSKESVSSRVAAIIATKKRRKAGKRRISEGMCFGLPTPDDPFRDRFFGRNDAESVDDDVLAARAKSRLKKILKVENDDEDDKINILEQKKNKKKKSSGKLEDAQKKVVKSGKKRLGGEEIGKADVLWKKDNASLIRPSKVLMLCLNTIQTEMQNEYDPEGDIDMPYFASSWGNEYLKNYASGNDMLVVGGPTVVQIAWIVSVAADNIQSLETKGLSAPAPFMLYIVPSQARAAEVRSVCKPLKRVGVHTVSVHHGVSVEHQINGLKSSEPEFIVSTPERLLELVSLKAVNISSVSLIVVDKLEPESQESQLEAIKSIRACITEEPITVVYDDDQSSYVLNEQSILREPFATMSLHGPVSKAKMHTNQVNDKDKHMKRPSKKGKSYKDKESCHCCQ